MSPVSSLSIFGILLLVVAIFLFVGTRGEVIKGLSQKAARTVGGVLLAAAIVVTLMASVYIVEPGYVGVEVLLGTVRTYADPGMRVKVPLSKVIYFNTREIMNKFQEDAASKDIQEVKINVAINYAIDNTKIEYLYREKAKNFDEVKSKLVDPFVQQAVKAATAMYDVEEIIVKRSELQSNITDRLTRSFTENYLKLRSVNIANIQFSEEFNKKIEEKQIEAQKVIIESNKLRQAVIRRKRVEEEAGAEAEKQRLLKEATSKEVVELKWIEKWDGKLPQVMTGNGSIPMVNLNN